MQWKLPFSDYFETEKTRLSRISSEYSPNLDQMMKENRNQIKSELSEQQMVVINRFPTPFDSIDQNWEKLDKLVDDWKDKKQIWPLTHNMKIISAVNGMSAFYITHQFRKAFKLADGRTAFLNSYVPAMALPLFFGSVLHYKLITAPIVSGVESCQMCRCLSAGLIQSVSSTVYPIIYSSISSIYFADYFMTFPTPDSIDDKVSRKYLYDIWVKAVRRNKIPLISLSIMNFIFAYYLTLKEEQTIEFMYFSLLSLNFSKTKSIQNK